MVKKKRPRDRLLSSAIKLMCERGVHATGLTELLNHSKTSRASIYHHFPGGKSDLMATATRVAGDHISMQLSQLLSHGTPAHALDAMLDTWVQVLASSDFAVGCPILAAAQSGPSEPLVSAAAAHVFAHWSTLIARSLADHGMSAPSASAMAGAIVSAIEGGIAQSRSARSTEPLEHVRVALVPVLKMSTLSAHSHATD